MTKQKTKQKSHENNVYCVGTANTAVNILDLNNV